MNKGSNFTVWQSHDENTYLQSRRSRVATAVGLHFRPEPGEDDAAAVNGAGNGAGAGEGEVADAHQQGGDVEEGEDEEETKKATPSEEARRPREVEASRLDAVGPAVEHAVCQRDVGIGAGRRRHRGGGGDDYMRRRATEK